MVTVVCGPVDDSQAGENANRDFISAHGGAFLNGQYLTFEQCVEHARNLGKSAHEGGQPCHPREDDGLDELTSNMRVDEGFRTIRAWTDGFNSYINLNHPPLTGLNE